MSGYEHSSAGSLYTYDTNEDSGYDAFDTAFSAWGYMEDQSNIANKYQQSPIEGLQNLPRQWPTANTVRQPFAPSQHLSASSFSSAMSSYRSSGNSSFSQTPLRDSMSSSISGYSNTSDMSRNQHFSMAEHLLCHGPVEPTLYDSSPTEERCQRPTKGKSPKKPVTQEKDYFKTCVSASKQSRVCSKKHKYFCTSCERPFVEKADWKRHEETYQERPEMFTCDLCDHIYFLAKDFTKHHAQAHRCTSCAEVGRGKKTHALSAKRRRMIRTGWGCGFCCHFSTDWTERCDHVARHMEKDELTAKEWKHTNVIYSLLQRPGIYHEWLRLSRALPSLTGCGWNRTTTGRVEGYPESNLTPQLQDYLEYFTSDQDAAAVAQMAYRKLKKASAPPPVPPKDYPAASVRNWDVEMYPWGQLTNSVVEDDVLPTGISRLDGWYAGS